jgi:uncharacterized protein (DUF58 family)
MTICAEGWCYLVVLSLVLWAAIVRDVNPLVLLAGMLLGPLLISWRVAALSVRRLAVDRTPPKQICAGELSTVEIVADNRRRRLGAWAVVVEDRIQLQSSGGGDGATAQVLFPHIAAGRTSRVGYRILLHRRGRYRFGPLKASTRFPLGFVQACVTISNFCELVVCPRMGRLTPSWSEAIEAERIGGHHWHRRHGVMEGDYYSVREWRDGDSRRWIHWRTTARLSRLAVRQFEQQGNRDVALILDLWQPSKATLEQQENVELAVSLAATVVADLCRRRARLLMAVAGKDRSRWSAPAASPLLQQEILEQLAVVEPAGEAALEDLVEEVLGELRPGAQAIVVSTRSADSADVDSRGEPTGGRRRQAALKDLAWIDVGRDDLSRFFDFPRKPSPSADAAMASSGRRRLTGAASS